MRRVSGVMLAAVVFAASVFLFGRTLWGAMRVDPSPVPAASTPVMEGAQVGEQGQEQGRPAPAPPEAGSPSAPRDGARRVAAEGSAGPFAGSLYPRVTEDEILGAVNRDLFEPDRRPPLQRYVLPSQRPEPTESARNDRRRRGPELRVVGAAIMGQTALAMVQVEDSVPLAVLLGESVEGYTLASVDAEGATLVNEDETLTLPVVEPIHPDPRVGNRRSSTADEAEAVRARVQDMIRNLQQRGMQRGGGGGGQAGGQTITIRRGAGGQIVAPIRIAPPPGGGGGELPASFTWRPGGGELPLRSVGVSGGGHMP